MKSPQIDWAGLLFKGLWQFFSQPVVLMVTLIFVLSGLEFYVRLKREAKANRLDCVPTKGLLTRAEAKFADVLASALDPSWHLFAKVRLADLVELEVKTVRGFNRICQKHVDFVIVSRSGWQVLAAVELDDGTHQMVQHVERDRLVDHCFASAKIPLIRVPQTSKGYNRNELRSQLEAIISSPTLSAVVS